MQMPVAAITLRIQLKECFATIRRAKRQHQKHVCCCMQAEPGHALLAAISTAGSCSCYGISSVLGSQLAGAIWPERLAYFQKEVEKQKGNLLSYIVFLRLTPILPNTFINLASPIVHVPLPIFMLGRLQRRPFCLALLFILHVAFAGPSCRFSAICMLALLFTAISGHMP